MRVCDHCGSRMAPFFPRTRVGDELWCQGCVEMKERHGKQAMISHCEVCYKPATHWLPWGHAYCDEHMEFIKSLRDRDPNAHDIGPGLDMYDQKPWLRPAKKTASSWTSPGGVTWENVVDVFSSKAVAEVGGYRMEIEVPMGVDEDDQYPYAWWVLDSEGNEVESGSSETPKKAAAEAEAEIKRLGNLRELLKGSMMKAKQANSRWRDEFIGKGLLGFPNSEIIGIEPISDDWAGGSPVYMVTVRTGDGRELRIPKNYHLIQTYERKAASRKRRKTAAGVYANYGWVITQETGEISDAEWERIDSPSNYGKAPGRRHVVPKDQRETFIMGPVNIHPKVEEALKAGKGQAFQLWNDDGIRDATGRWIEDASDLGISDEEFDDWTSGGNPLNDYGYGGYGSTHMTIQNNRSYIGRKAASRKVAHDSGDGETIYHCPFCGAGQVIGRSDGTAQCQFCDTAFTVQVQPSMSAVPQTIDGEPHVHPDMPGEEPGSFEEGPLVEEEQMELEGDEKEEGMDQNPNPFESRLKFRAGKHHLDAEEYLRHLAIKFADDREAVVRAVRTSRKKTASASDQMDARKVLAAYVKFVKQSNVQDQLNQLREKASERPELVAGAEIAYNNQDQGWFDSLSLDDLVFLWGINPMGMNFSWDDEVFEALESKGYFSREGRKTASLQIRETSYRGEDGFLIVGTDGKGRSGQKVWVPGSMGREAAEAIREKMKQGEEWSYNDFTASRKTADISPDAAGVKVGDIFVSEWGYDQTNVDFYQVTRLTGASAYLRKIAKKTVSGDSWMGKVMPIPGNFVGEEFIKRILMTEWRSDPDPYFSLTSYSSAYPWDGQPVAFTGYA